MCMSGNGIAKDHFISIFLELSAGFPGSNKYEYRVEMMNHKVCDINCLLAARVLMY